MHIIAIVTSDGRTKAEKHIKALQCLAEQIAHAEAQGLLEGLTHVRDDITYPLSNTTQIVSRWGAGGSNGELTGAETEG